MSHSPTAEVPRPSLLLVTVGGLMALAGTYWDDAFHTHVGRDEFASPPHLLLYAGVLVALGGVWSWAAVARRTDGRPWRSDPALALAAAGGLTTLASGPIDEVWHAAFGRDAVLWSPPHTLGIVGMFVLAAGVLAGAARSGGPGRRRWVVVTGTAVLGATMIPVMEYEADVPQFADLWYVPVTVAGMVLAFALVERADPSPRTVPLVAVTYTAVRAAVVGLLTLLGFSTPLIPPIIVPALVFSATRRLRPGWRALAVTGGFVASYAPMMNLVIRGVRLDWLDITVGGALAVFVAWLVLRTFEGRGSSLHRTARLTTVGSVVAIGLLVPAVAFAHDPGQGEPVAPVELEATARAGLATVHARLDHPECATIEAEATVARRGGRVHTGTLVERAACVFEGEVDLDGPGRWFVYVELTGQGGAAIEAWLPITPPEAASDEPVTEHKADWAYLPAGSDDTSIVQALGGIALYAVAALLLIATVRTSHPIRTNTSATSTST